MTELGWSTIDATCPSADKAAGVSEAQQAQFLTKAYGASPNDPYVDAGAVVRLARHRLVVEHPRLPLGLVTNAFVRKPAFAAFQHAGGAQPIACGGVMDDRRRACRSSRRPTTRVR